MFFVGHTEIKISDQDVDLLTQYPWKVREDKMIVEDFSKYEKQPERSPKLLRTLIAFRMGLDADHYVLFRSTDWTDLRRENLQLVAWTAEDFGFNKK